MKHISEFLVPKLQRIEEQRAITLFDAPREKGSKEWRTFNVVTKDTVAAYPVRTPRAVVVTKEDRVLRITYSPMRVARGV